MLRVAFSSTAPIWSQIQEAVRWSVATGELPPGAAIASVRNLSRALHVSPATVAKAYQMLADEGIIEVRRGIGTFVSDSPPTRSRPVRRRRLSEGARRFACLAASLGLDSDDTKDEFEKAWAQIERARGNTR